MNSNSRRRALGKKRREKEKRKQIAERMRRVLLGVEYTALDTVIDLPRFGVPLVSVGDAFVNIHSGETMIVREIKYGRALVVRGIGCMSQSINAGDMFLRAERH